jgi:hypothetical protein
MPLRSYPPEEVLSALLRLRNQLGRRAFKPSGPRVFGSHKSIQGKWQPNLFNKYPLAELSKVHPIPDVPAEKVERIKPLSQVREKDFAN